ncbi:MAG: hypothetical protein KC592_14430, partial [Nitrospira sp.]|nr:hypothetical protein [Nitrospira sp.]
MSITITYREAPLSIRQIITKERNPTENNVRNQQVPDSTNESTKSERSNSFLSIRLKLKNSHGGFKFQVQRVIDDA